MPSSGTITGSWRNYTTSSPMPFTVLWEVVSQSPATNTSSVRFRWRCKRESSEKTTNKTNAPWSRNIAGTAGSGKVNFNISNTSVGSFYVFLDQTLTIPHNADGTKTAAVSGEIDLSGTSAGIGSWSANIVLPTITATPEIDVDITSRTSATRGGSNGAATLSLVTASGGAAGVSYNYNITLNGTTVYDTSSLTVSNLRNNTEYAYSALIENSFGTQATESGTFYLDPVAPLLSVGGVSVDVNSAVLALSAVYDTLRAFSAYEVEYGTTQSYGSTSSSGLLSGLTPETTYYYRARVTDQNNGGADSAAYTSAWVTGSFTTLTDQAGLKFKAAGAWVSGKVWIKKNGTWVKGKKVYTKSTTWKAGV